MSFLPRLFQPAERIDPDADPELEAIIACLKLIGRLTPAARERVIRYLAERVEEMRAYTFEE